MAENPEKQLRYSQSPANDSKKLAKKNARSRKPDRAVYVPRAKRMEAAGRRKLEERSGNVPPLAAEEEDMMSDNHDTSPPTEEGSLPSHTPSPPHIHQDPQQQRKDPLLGWGHVEHSEEEKAKSATAYFHQSGSTSPLTPPHSAPPTRQVLGSGFQQTAGGVVEGRRKSADDWMMSPGAMEETGAVGGSWKRSSKPPRNPNYPPGYVSATFGYNKPPPPQPQPNKRPLQVIEEMMRKSGMDDSPPSSPIAVQSASSASVVAPPTSSVAPPTFVVATPTTISPSVSSSGQDFEMKSRSQSSSNSLNSMNSAEIESGGPVRQGGRGSDETDIHLTLEKKLSSPLISPITKSAPADGVSPFSPKASPAFADPSAASEPQEEAKSALPAWGGSPPPDPEDLEVQMINESFEELQKRQKLYESKQLKDLFYSYPNAAGGNKEAAMTSEVTSSAVATPAQEQQPVWKKAEPAGMPALGGPGGPLEVWSKKDVPGVEDSGTTSILAQKQGTAAACDVISGDKTPSNQPTSSFPNANPSSDTPAVTLPAPDLAAAIGQANNAAAKVTWAGWGSRESHIPPNNKMSSNSQKAAAKMVEMPSPGTSSNFSNLSSWTSGNSPGIVPIPGTSSGILPIPGDVSGIVQNSGAVAALQTLSSPPGVRRLTTLSAGDFPAEFAAAAPSAGSVAGRKAVSVDSGGDISSDAAMDQLSMEMAEKVLSDLDDELLSPFSPQGSVSFDSVKLVGPESDESRFQEKETISKEEERSEEVMEGVEVDTKDAPASLDPDAVALWILQKELDTKNTNEEDPGDVKSGNGAMSDSVIGGEETPVEEKKPEEAGIEHTVLASQAPKGVEEGEEGWAEDSWEDLCDEDGNSVDPKLMQEINLALGKVKIATTKFDYYGYRPKDVELDQNEFSHVLEVYGFPSEYKPSDLREALMALPPEHYDVTWVDNTHALIAFTNTQAAKEALNMSHPGVELRPLSQASSQSKQKAATNAEFLRPKKPRPSTTAAAARRMVELHLGKRSSASMEKRKQERVAIAQAKEHKVTTIRQKESAWEGNL